MIRVQNLEKYYGDTLAVDNLTFEVPEGEIVGFLGPNGAGKSTTMKILTGFVAATSGDAEVAGHDVFSDSIGARRATGYLPENVPLYPEMRVGEYLRFRARLKEVPRRSVPVRVSEAMDRVEIAPVAKRLIGQLSKGYRQRVGIAAALLHRPKVLILDEPTVGLDPTQIRATRHFIHELGGEHTILLSSHVLPEVEAICERVMILHRGRVVAMDTPTRLMRDVQGGGAVRAEVRGDAVRLRKAVAALDVVADVDVTERDGVATLEIKGREPHDIREPVSRAIVEAGGVIREFRTHHVTLEDVFVRITRHDVAEDSATGAGGDR